MGIDVDPSTLVALSAAEIEQMHSNGRVRDKSLRQELHEGTVPALRRRRLRCHEDRTLCQGAVDTSIATSSSQDTTSCLIQ